MLTDRIRIKVKAGKGGNGKVSFGRNRKPDGGDGGKGADIILEGSENIYDLSKLKNIHKYEGKNGEMGGSERSSGKAGEDLIIKVPITTTVLSEDGTELARIIKKEQSFTIAKGGRGGLGNFNFKHGQRLTLTKTYPGESGDESNITLILKLIADIIFIGFPNAGKSSMLNMLTNADVKVASYPFTTLEPYLGVCEGLLLMDLPGLIEGSHEGKGVGTKFKKHTEYSKVVAHFISLEADDLIDSYKQIRAELKEMDETLFSKPEFLVLTKSDMFDEGYIKTKEEQIKQLGLPYIVTSCYDFSKLDGIKKFLKKQIENI